MSAALARIIAIVLFVGLPVLEISVLIRVGSVIGFWPTLLLIILTALIGTTLLRIQGAAVFLDAKSALSQNRFPASSVLEGIILLVSALFLIIPGFVTDGLGIILLIPPLRHRLLKLILKLTQVPQSEPFEPEAQPAQTSPFKETDHIIDGEFRDL